MLKYYGNLKEDIEEEGRPEVQVCIDEVNRGGLFGDVYICATIWDPLREDDDMSILIKDSKKIPKKKRPMLRKYIEENAVDYVVCSVNNKTIDKINILQSTFKGMHQCLDIITQRHKIDRILVDGNFFPTYKCYPHTCVVKGDATYLGIACSSILAKCNHDDRIEKLCAENPSLNEKYDMLSNRGYGTKKHIQGIKDYGITSAHRTTFCKRIDINPEFKNVVSKIES